MRVLITGGAGFIGSHIADALCDGGHHVLIIDDLSHGKRDYLPHAATFVLADIRSGPASAAIEEFKPEAVLHHAAQAQVRQSVADPIFDAEINVLGTLHIAQAAARCGCSTFVFASTGGAIYGEQEKFPADENHPIAPVSPYGISKRCGEIYLDYIGKTSGMRTVFLRYANVYGPRQNPHGEAGVVGIFTHAMLSGKTPVIFGDGLQTRDYVYIHDVVRANLLALQNKATSGPYNIGTGFETDIQALARLLQDIIGFKGSLNEAPAKPGEQRRSVLHAGRAQRELGWVASTPLPVGLAQTVEWYQQHLEKN